MDPDLRTALLLLGLIFCGFFAAVTIFVIVDTGLHLRTYGDIGAVGLYGVSLLITRSQMSALSHWPSSLAWTFMPARWNAAQQSPVAGRDPREGNPTAAD